MLPRAVATLLPENLRANVRALARFAGVRVLLPVKADGYGHGLTQVVEATRDLESVWGYGVATPREALEAASAAFGKPVLLLTPADSSEMLDLAGAGVRLAVGTPEEVAALPENARVHLKVNTGMNRLGVWWQDAPALIDVLWKRGQLEGVMTHFASADEEDLSHAREQLRRFQDVLRHVPAGVLRHASNSGGVLSFGREAAFDLVRPGIASYGFAPEAHLQRAVPLAPALRLTARVTHVSTVRAGERVSYGGLWQAPRDTTVAVIGVGYADGLPRRASGHAAVLVHGERRDVLGRICMDQCMVDAEGLGVRPGDTVEVFGAGSVRASDLAQWAGTNVYEVLTGIGRRVERAVLEETRAASSHA